MAKKDPLNIDLPVVAEEAPFEQKPGKITQKISALGSKIFGVIKLLLGLCLLPFVYAATVSLLSELTLVDKIAQGYFWLGIASFLAIHLFIWEPAVVYAKGHKILEIIFNFVKPLVRVAPYVLPIYTIVLFVGYQLLSLAIKSVWLLRYSIFLLSFSVILHLVFSAKSVRSKKGDFLKGNYIFGFSFIYIINLMLLSLCLSFILKEFSVVNFFNNTFSTATNILYAVIKQLFLR